MKYALVILFVVSVGFVAVWAADKNDKAKYDKPAPDAKAVDLKIEKVVKTPEEWKKQLTPQQYNVLREKGTERAFTGELLKIKDEGTYVCAACDFELFGSDSKFDSGTGWPSFFKPVKPGHVREDKDTAHGMVRTEVLCPRCDGHLGHVFEDGPKPTGLRYCMNSVSMKFVPAKKAEK